MKRLIAFLLILLPAAAEAASPAVSELQEAFASIAAQARPAVVNITAIHEERAYVPPQYFFGDPDELFYEFFQGHPPSGRLYRWKTHGTGSGSIIDPRGYILTNEHVIRGADEIQITLTDPEGRQKTVKGRVIGKDSATDLAVVKIQSLGTYPYLRLGDSDKMRVGYWVLAIGSPFELQQTVTAGIVSAVRQTLRIEGRPYYNLFQTDTAINQGNSGGPLLNIQGEIIGINTAIYSPSGAFAGIGFAIPVNEAKAVLGYLLEGKMVRHGWLGVEAYPVDEVMKNKFGLDSTDGALVNSVLRGSPAHRAGLRRGDVILRLNNELIRTPVDLVQAVGRTRPGQRISLEIHRAGSRKNISVTVGDRRETAEENMEPAPERKERQAPSGGQNRLAWEGITFIQAQNGVAIKDIAPESKLYGYLLKGDVIQGVNQSAVGTLAALDRLLPKIQLKEGVVFDILRQGQDMYISVQTTQ